MLIDVEPRPDAIAILRLRGRGLHSDMLGPLVEMCTKLEAQGKYSVAIDLSRVNRISISGLAALVELLSVKPDLNLAYCAIGKRALRELARLGLERAMPLFPTIDDAVRSKAFSACRHHRVQVVLTCPENLDHNQIFPIGVQPWAFDVVGKPLIHRTIDLLAGHGIRDVLLMQDGIATQFDKMVDLLSGRLSVWTLLLIDHRNRRRMTLAHLG